jgi:Domain of unknown function (DUF4395)
MWDMSVSALCPARCGRMGELLAFPNPVNETSARVVAGGVVGMTMATIVFDQPWILVPLTYGFAARVLSGPKLSPLGLLATKVVTPRLAAEHRFTAGPPKRLAQGMGLTLSGTALVLHYGFGRKRAAKGVLAVLATAAGLEACFGLCLACRMFPLLMKLGLVPQETCEKCANFRAGPETSEGRAPDLDGLVEVAAASCAGALQDDGAMAGSL